MMYSLLCCEHCEPPRGPVFENVATGQIIGGRLRPPALKISVVEPGRRLTRMIELCAECVAEGTKRAERGR